MVGMSWTHGNQIKSEVVEMWQIVKTIRKETTVKV